MVKYTVLAGRIRFRTESISSERKIYGYRQQIYGYQTEIYGPELKLYCPIFLDRILLKNDFLMMKHVLVTQDSSAYVISGGDSQLIPGVN